MRPGSKRLLLFGAAAAGAAALAGAAVHSLFGFAARRKPPVPMPHVTDLNNNPYADEIRAGSQFGKIRRYKKGKIIFGAQSFSVDDLMSKMQHKKPPCPAVTQNVNQKT